MTQVALCVSTLQSLEGRIRLLRTSANWLIYASVILGVALLAQLYTLVPYWLFYFVLVGWVAYVAVAIAAAHGREIAYPSALILSLLTLSVSIPQPEHYSLVSAGLTVASLTFISGSVLQVGVIMSILSYLLLKRMNPRRTVLVGGQSKQGS